jgi:hypothetical protein
MYGNRMSLFLVRSVVAEQYLWRQLVPPKPYEIMWCQKSRKHNYNAKLLTLTAFLWTVGQRLWFLPKQNIEMKTII